MSRRIAGLPFGVLAIGLVRLYQYAVRDPGSAKRAVIFLPMAACCMVLAVYLLVS